MDKATDPRAQEPTLLAFSCTREVAGALLKILDRDRFGDTGGMVRKGVIAKEFSPDLKALRLLADNMKLGYRDGELEAMSQMELLELSLQCGSLMDPTMSAAYLATATPRPQPGIVLELAPGYFVRTDCRGVTQIRQGAAVFASTTFAYSVLNEARSHCRPAGWLEWRMRDNITNEILDSEAGGTLRPLGELLGPNENSATIAADEELAKARPLGELLGELLEEDTEK